MSNDLVKYILENYGVVVSFLTIFFAVKSAYMKIKFECLVKATEKIAAVEKLENLSGEQKFSLVISWINVDLPKLFKNKLFIAVVETIVQKSYDNSSSYMKNYIKRKTGYDISEVIAQLQEMEQNSCL